MTLTEDKFEDLKADYVVYGPITTTDAYGNETAVYSFPKAVLHTMWRPVSDEASVALYGADVKTMREAVIYDTAADIDVLDQVEISGERYEVVSIKYYNTHRLLKVRRVHNGGTV